MPHPGDAPYIVRRTQIYPHRRPGRLGIAPYLEDGATYVRRLRTTTVVAIRHFPMFPGLEPAYRR
jgi:hypothetical protein